VGNRTVLPKRSPGKVLNKNNNLCRLEGDLLRGKGRQKGNCQTICTLRESSRGGGNPFTKNVKASVVWGGTCQ